MSASAWVEIARDVFQQRYQPVDVSVVAVVGGTGVTVIDTRNNPAEGAEIIADVAARFGLPVVAVVNTHAHYDHSFGNQAFAALGIPRYGHHLVARHYADYEEPRLLAVQTDPGREPDKAWEQVTLSPPTHLVDRRMTVVAGGRTVELIPLAPGHTDTDLAIFVPDVRVWILGDVIEQSGPPMAGSGSFPLAWPDVLDDLLTRLDPADVIVPGHGAVVDRDFVRRQAADLRALADAIRTSWAAGLPVDDAVAAAARAAPTSSWPAHMLLPAFERGYAHLAR
jgi:glyoxylase-like metal-dependent hydrolase (beta-lactamase superfamily II)